MHSRMHLVHAQAVIKGVDMFDLLDRASTVYNYTVFLWMYLKVKVIPRS